MPVFNNIIAGASGATGAAAGFQIERSLRFNSADSAYLNRTPSSAGNRKTWTWSSWVKFTKFSQASRLFAAGANNDNRTIIHYDSSNNKIKIYSTVGGVVKAELTTDAVLRDPSSFYHVVVSFDAANTNVDIYINGVEQTLTASTSVANENHNINNTVTHKIGQSVDGNVQADLYLAETHFVDGQALTPTDFGEYDDNNVWQPKEYSGTYGTNGFHLDFSDNSSNAALGTDSSGNSNTWTVNNLSVASGAGNDSLIDTPTNYDDGTNVGGNYCTLNPLKNGQTLSNGNLDVVGVGTSWQRSVGTLGMYSGKYYWEYTITASNEHIIGVGPVDMQLSGNLGAGSPPGSGYATELGSVNGTGANGSWTNTGASGAGDIIGIAFDADNGNMYVYKNGTALNSGTASHTGLVMPQIPVVSLNGSSRSGTINFGQRPFAYTPPTGYVSLCTTNLPDPTIADGSTAMDVALWTGNGSARSISGLNFSPDFVWMKARTLGTASHGLFDIVRGATKRLISNSTGSESTQSQTLTAFNSDGFDLGTDAAYNGNTYPVVGWTWDGGSSTVSNTDGSITSNVRANASAGFSIVGFTGTGSAGTVGHGLNAAPSLVIVKNRDAAAGWLVWVDGFSSTEYLVLNSTNAKASNSGYFNGVPTSTTFSISTANNTNGNGDDMIAYCFAPVEGYSAFGSYTGNGSTDGPFVFTGMRPAFIMIKRTDLTGDWLIYDTARDEINAATKRLYPNLANAEADASDQALDILSNGFCIKGGSNANYNASGGTYIYACFSEHPFKTARAR